MGATTVCGLDECAFARRMVVTSVLPLAGLCPNEIAADLVTFDQMLHPDQQQATFAAMEAALRDFQPFDMEYQLRTKSGQYRWFPQSCQRCISMSSVRRHAWRGRFRTFTNARWRRRNCRNTWSRCRPSSPCLPDGFVSFDTSGKVSYVSPAFTALTGIAEQAVLELDEVAFGAALFRASRRGQAVASIDDVRHHAGRVVLEMKPPARRMLEFRLSRGQGQAVAQVLALRDVTHRNRSGSDEERLPVDGRAWVAHADGQHLWVHRVVVDA